MASDILDRVGMVITTTGAGPVTANVLISNRFNTPAEAGAVNGVSYWWMLEEDNDYQIFEGVWTASGTSIARTTTWHSKIGGVHAAANMNLGGNATLRSITPAEAFLGIVRFDRDQVLTQTDHTRAKKNLKVGRSDNAGGDLSTLFEPGFHDGQFTNAPDANFLYVRNQSHSNDPGSPTPYFSQELDIGLDGTVEPRYFRRLCIAGAFTPLKEIGLTPIVLYKTANYSVTWLDAGRLISASIAKSSTLNLTLPSGGGPIANGWSFFVENTGNGAVVLVGTVDGIVNMNVFKGQSFEVVRDGSGNWKTKGRQSVFTFARSSGISAVSAFDTTLPDGLKVMQMFLTNVWASTAGAALIARSSQNGTTFDAGASDYVGSGLYQGTSSTPAAAASVTLDCMTVSQQLLNSGGGGSLNGVIDISNGSSLQINSHVGHYNQSGNFMQSNIWNSYRNGGTLPKALRLQMTSGNLSADSIVLTGIAPN